MVQRADAAGQHGLRVLEVSEALAGSNTVVGVNYLLLLPFFLAHSSPLIAETRKGRTTNNLSKRPTAQFLSLLHLRIIIK